MRFDGSTFHPRILICAEAVQPPAAYDEQVSRFAQCFALMERTMLPIIVGMFFLLACGAGWVLLFPDAGEAVQRRFRAWLPQRAAAFMRTYSLPAAAGALLITAPPLAVWLSGGKVALPGAGERAVNAHLDQLLRGERLVPPPTLPPMAFTSREVTLVRPMLASANRNWTLLDADFSQRLLAVFRIMREQHGYEMALLEGYRGPERQNQLAAAGSNMTNARAFQSYHQFGLAADCAFLRDGKLVISERDPWAMRGYQLYGEAAESVGLKWGGRWTMMDFGHVELRQSGNGH
jgi:peptidoglycan L-alanyl-D-glutamate endopeptidase CwlK